MARHVSEMRKPSHALVCGIHAIAACAGCRKVGRQVLRVWTAGSGPAGTLAALSYHQWDCQAAH